MTIANLRLFLSKDAKISKCNTGHLTNGAWAILPKRLPYNFSKRFQKLLKDNKLSDLKSIINNLPDSRFKLNLNKYKNASHGIRSYKINQIDKIINLDYDNYLSYLLKHISNLDVYVTSPTHPTILINNKRFFHEEVGLLMPCQKIILT